MAVAFGVLVPHSPAAAAGTLAPAEMQALVPANATVKAALEQTTTKATSERSPSTQVAGDPRGVYGPEQRAQELYLDALEKLEAGRQLWARRTFETLVARYPESRAASMARGQLADLYRATALPLEKAIPPGPPARVPPPVETIALAAPGSLRDLPNWDVERRQHSAIQARLRTEAGDRVFFSQGSADLGGRARSALVAQARWLNKSQDFEVAIEGHADEPGSTDDNVALSERRAIAVRERLVEEGVDAERIIVLPRGSTERLATCREPECKAQNRRAVTIVVSSGTIVRLRQIAQQKGVKPHQPQAQALGLPPQPRGRPATSSWQGVPR